MKSSKKKQRIREIQNGEMSEDDSILEIDRDALDREWVNQPKLFYKWSEKLARRKKKVDEAKAHLQLTDAQLGSKMRENPIEYGLPKTTDATVEAFILQHPDHVAALEAFNYAKFRVELGEAMVDALRQRKDGLQDLVKLHGQQYFASPAISDNPELMDQMQKRAARMKAKGV